MEFTVQQFKQSKHPYVLPDMIDIFKWSTPYVSEKITEIFDTILTGDAKLTKMENKKLLLLIGAGKE